MTITKEISLYLRAALGGVRVETRDEFAFFAALRDINVGEPPPEISVVSWSPISGGLKHTVEKTEPFQSGKSGKLEPTDAGEFLANGLLDWVAMNTASDDGDGRDQRSKKRGPLVFCLVGCDAVLADPQEDTARRAVLEAVVVARSRAALICVVGSGEIHPELAQALAHVRHGLPSKEEAREHVVGLLATVGITAPAPAFIDDLLDAGQGLTLTKQLDAIGVALKQASRDKRNPRAADVLAYKEREMAQGALLARRPRHSLDALVGYPHLKSWLKVAHASMSPAARRAGLPPPKGVLLAGPPGTGKSRLCEATAAAWSVPWLLFDISRIFHGIIGESESAMRDALDTATRMAPCVLQVDEVDTAFPSRGAVDVDGGLTKRVFGNLLQWLADKEDEVFVMMTSNRPQDLDAALARSGRLDATFFVDLPDEEARAAIWQHYLKLTPLGAQLEAELLKDFVKQTVFFAPGEIEAVVLGARRHAFAAGRAVQVSDLMKELALLTPVARSMAEKIEKMRSWSQQFARPA